MFIKVNGEPAKSLLDTGAEVNILSADLLFENQVDLSCPKRLNGIGGQCWSVGKTTIPIKIDQMEVNCEFEVVMPEVLGNYKCFLGWKFLKDNKALLDFDKNVLIINSYEIELLSGYMQTPPHKQVQKTTMAPSCRPKDLIQYQKTKPLPQTNTLISHNTPKLHSKPKLTLKMKQKSKSKSKSRNQNATKQKR